MSPQQKRLWALERSDRSPFAVACWVRIEGNLDPSVLTDAVARMIKGNEVLRTHFDLLAGMSLPVQAISDAGSYAAKDLDLRGMDPKRQQTEQEKILEEMLEPISPMSAPTLKIVLARLSDNSRALFARLPGYYADGRSLRNLIAGTARFCGVEIAGCDPGNESIQYADAAEEFNYLLTSEENERYRRYWMRQGLSLRTSVRLPFEALKPVEQEFRPYCVKREIDGPTGDRIAAIARKVDAPVSSFLLACWRLLLSRLTDRSDVVVGGSFDGRSYQGLDSAIGLFERTLPIRAIVDERSSLVEFLKQTDGCAREAREWQDYFSLEHLVEHEDNEASQLTFLPYSFSFENEPPSFRSPELRFSFVKQYSLLDRFNARLHAIQHRDEISLELHYDPALYRKSDIERLAAQFVTLTERAARHPDKPLYLLEHLPPSERDAVLVDFNRTDAPLAGDPCIHELFERQAEQIPDRVAVAFLDQCITYRAINREANLLAHRLTAAGVGAEIPVCLNLSRGPQWIVGVLGVLKAGGAYIPFDGTYPRARLESIIREAGARVLVEEGLSGEERNLRLTAISDGGVQAAGSDADSVGCTVSDNLAYILYTSGSTGRPKGVMVQHGSLVNLFNALNAAIYRGRSEGLCIGLNASIMFDASVKQILQLLNGCSIHIIPEEVRSDGERFLAYMREHNIAAFDCTPFQAKSLINAGLLNDAGGPQIVLVGGEAFEQDAWSSFARSSRISAFNVYGPTECTVDATTAMVSSYEGATIGRPINNVAVYLLDGYIRPAGIGIPGEMYIGGAGVGRGYLGQPAQTAERFIPDPFSGGDGTRLYKTGDAGCHLPDGRIKFLSRIDHQVKIRGFRIELGEIEAAISETGLAANTAVLARTTGERSELVAYVVPAEAAHSTLNNGAAADSIESELRLRLRAALPEYMIPSAFVLLAEIPVTRNGKVDRAALATLQPDAALIRQKYAPPRNQLEKMIASVWQEELKVERVGLNDNFFDLGGHSLLMTRVYYRLEPEFRGKLSIVEMFRNPTIGTLAQFLNEDSSRLAPLENVEASAQRQKTARAKQKQMAQRGKNGFQ